MVRPDSRRNRGLRLKVPHLRRWNRVASTLCFALAGWLPSLQADEGVAHCVAIDDAVARLACFDEATGRAGRAAVGPAPAAETPAPAPVFGQAAASPTAADVERFGLSAQQFDNAPSAISAVVRSVDPHPHVGRWVVTLDNGQVWEQRETTAAAKRPRPGDQVTIQESSFGSYLMIAPGRGSSRVKRIR
jgi:hypothetical protein